MEFYAFKDASRPFFPLSLFPLYSRGAINNPEKLAQIGGHHMDVGWLQRLTPLLQRVVVSKRQNYFLLKIEVQSFGVRDSNISR